jgi:pre-mRNA-splicing helicase BRR2
VFLGNQASSILRDAAEEVIQILKDGGLRDPERHDQISRLLTGKAGAGSNRNTVNGGMAPEKYAEFVRLGKRLDDYDEVIKQGGDGGSGDTNNQNGNKDRVDDEMGVAVVFDDSDDADEDPNRPEGASDIEDGVVIDASSDSESDDEDDGNDNSQEPRGRDVKGGGGNKNDNGR